jgi:hypothetical protein
VRAASDSETWAMMTESIMSVTPESGRVDGLAVAFVGDTSGVTTTKSREGPATNEYRLPFGLIEIVHGAA